MRRFGWMRLACLFLVLTVLAALVRLDGGGAGARSLAARVPDAMFLASERPEEPPATPRTEAQISSLEDVSEDALRMGVGPTPPTRPGFRRQEAETQAKEKARTELSTEPPVFYRSASPGAPAGSGGFGIHHSPPSRDGRTARIRLLLGLANPTISVVHTSQMAELFNASRTAVDREVQRRASAQASE